MGHLPLFGILLLSMVEAIIAELPEYTGCGATIRGIPEGIINYPNGRGWWYPINEDCKWNIILGEGERMALSFERFHVNGYSEDILVIKNGETGTSIGTFDGNPKGQLGGKMPPNIESETNAIFLHFTSDHRWNGKGFKMTWKKSKSGNQCMANETKNSILWQQVVSSETAVKAIVNESNDSVIGIMALKIQELKMDLQEMKNKQATTQFQLQEIKNKQDTTQSKLDFIIEELIGFGCWSVMSNVTHPEGFSESHECIMYTCTNGKWLQDGPDLDCYTDNNTESPLQTYGDIMVRDEPPFILTEHPTDSGSDGDTPVPS